MHNWSSSCGINGWYWIKNESEAKGNEFPFSLASLDKTIFMAIDYLHYFGYMMSSKEPIIFAGKKRKKS